MAAGIPTYWTVLIAITFLIVCTLFLHSAFKGYWLEKEAPKSVRVLLAICATAYLLAVLFSFLVYLFTATFGYNSSPPLGVEHPAVVPVRIAFVLCYAVSILLNLYVWMQRLQYIYMNSIYGVSATLIKCLKLAYAFLLVFALVVVVLFMLYVFSITGPTYQLFTVIFAVLLLAESVTIAIAFVLKLRSMRNVWNQQASNGEEEKLVSVRNLVYVQMKLTIVVCVQVLSTPIGLMLDAALPAEVLSPGLPIDAFIGFLCVYCTVRPTTLYLAKCAFSAFVAANCASTRKGLMTRTRATEQRRKQPLLLHPQTLQCCEMT